MDVTTTYLITFVLMVVIYVLCRYLCTSAYNLLCVSVSVKVKIFWINLKMIKFLSVLVLCLGFVCSQYTSSISRELAVYSIMVYEPEDQLHSWTCYQCHEFQLTDRQTWYVKSKNAFGMIGYSPNLKAIVIAFRGTQSKSTTNMATDIDMLDRSYERCQGCRVHKGFYQCFQAQFDLMQTYLDKLLEQYPEAPIHVTGHSLGGAVATLTAAELSADGNYNVGDVYTYGEPRVGNKKFAAWFNQQLDQYRVVHYKDLIPSVPPKRNPLLKVADAFQSINLPKIKIPKIKLPKIHFAAQHQLTVQNHEGLLDFEYFHEGIEIWYSSDMKNYQVCESQDPKCFDSVKVYNPLDHLKKYYLVVPAAGNLVTHFQVLHTRSSATHFHL